MSRCVRFFRLAFATGLVLALMPGTATAYIGPGGGLSLLSTAIAMLAAYSVATVVVLTWPIRAAKRWWRQYRGKDVKTEENNEAAERLRGKE